MSKTAIVWSCAHADPRADNERALWLGNLIHDIKPDYVVDLGDTADLTSLSSHDTRYPQKMVASEYESDINAYLDFQEKVRYKIKKSKKKQPAFFGFEGNHENRIKKAVALDPRLEGSKYGISFSHLETNRYYNEYHEYSCGAPALHSYDGILYGHYVASGNYGSALSTKHHGYSLVEKLGCSATVGHSHKFSYYRKQDAYPSPCHGLVAGCFKGREEDWAGQANREWSKGVVIKRGVENGNYDLQWVSMKQLREEYGGGGKD